MMNKCVERFRFHIVPYWRSFIVILVPLILLPLPIIHQTTVSLLYICLMFYNNNKIEPIRTAIL